MDNNSKNKSIKDFIFISKYSKQEGVYKETYTEAVSRVMSTHYEYLTENFNIKDEEKFTEYFNLANESYLSQEILGAQRSLQFGGQPMLKHQFRMYNCSSSYIDRIDFFKELFYILLCGAGAGYSVQSIHTKHLPKVKGFSKESGVYKIEDSIEGWALSTDVIIKAFFDNKELPIMDYSNIRDKGAFISGGFKAPGSEPLKKAHSKIINVLKGAIGRKLSNFECHLMACIIADAVIAGGVRRSALIVLFDADDEEMLSCKTGDWFIKYPELARSNNSAVILPETDKEVYLNIFEATKEYGEPAFAFLQSPYHAFNPCFRGSDKLLTSDGYKSFKELEGVDFDIINANSKISKGKVWKSGIKKTISLKDKKGRTLVTCTEDHIFKTTDGDDIKASDSVRKKIATPFINKRELSNEFIRFGFIQGDGCLGRLKSNTHKGLEVNIGVNDEDVRKLFNIYDDLSPNKNGVSYYIKSDIKEKLISLGFDSSKLPNRALPSTYTSWSNKNKKSFLCGLFSANGSVIKNSRVQFKTTSKKLVDELIEALSEFEIESYYTTNKSKNVKFNNGDYLCKESYDICIYNQISLSKFYNEIGFIHHYKNMLLHSLEDRGCYVFSIDENGYEDVYDFSEPIDHWGIVNGLQAHNCFEIGMIPSLKLGDPRYSGWSVCNLTEQNGSLIDSKEKFLKTAKNASILGTFQAAYTNFPFLGSVTEQIVKRDALLGVSITGMCENPEILFDPEIQKEAAKLVVKTNIEVSKLLGINPAARATAIKPSGNASQMLGTLSGIHAGHSKRYIRNVQVNEEEQAGKVFIEMNPESSEKSVWSSSGTDYILSFPVEISDSAIVKEDISAIEFMDKVKLTQNNWIKYGTNLNHEVYRNDFAKGLTHNVSNTITVNPNEWYKVRDYLWENKESFCGVSMLSNTGDLDYPQAPFVEVIDEIELSERFGVASILASGLVVDGMKAFSNNLFEACDTAITNITGIKKMYSKELSITPEYISNFIKSKIKVNDEKNVLEFKTVIDGVLVTDTNAIIASLYAQLDKKIDWVRRFKQFAKNYLSGNYEKTSECLKRVSYLHKWETVSKSKIIDWSNVEWKEDYIDVETISAQGCYGGKCEI